MAGKTLDLKEILTSEQLATQIANQFEEWSTFRAGQIEKWKEIRNYVFATDTKTTSNSKLPWKNSTTLPKLCQIRDNLHANYMAALFPNDSWLKWEGDDENAEAQDKRETIQAYMVNKTRTSSFRTTVSQLVYDWIDTGNIYSSTEFVDESYVDGETGEVIPGYVGPRLVRLSPYDVVFNPLAPSFESAPKIIRSIKTIGELQADIHDYPGDREHLQKALDLVKDNRTRVASLSAADQAKATGYIFDGFSSIMHYYQSDYVEVLEFHGDLYDRDSGTLLKNHVITVLDRAHILRKKMNPTWKKGSGIRHCGWRLRPDNLYAMSPLENLVGMQYRIDHLENLQADAMDLFVFPMAKIRGDVEDFEFGPGERVYTSEDGDVDFMRPNLTQLPELHIQAYEARMEEYVGAPKQAMGIRTPGEKTKYEVQTLENAAGRIFQNKVTYLEESWLEPTLNDMLESGRRNLNESDVIRVMDEDIDVVLFKTITKEDITAAGKLRPIGARHFARRANMLQNLTNFANSAVGQDPAVNVHISGLKTAKLMEELLDIEKFDLVEENIRIMEQTDTQRIAQTAQQQVTEEAAVNMDPAELEAQLNENNLV